VHLGDLIVGDADGVVCVPASRTGEVRTLSREQDDSEIGYIERLRGGTTLDIYRLP
jgi:4-hydroxy-4-methyl-2-oxoglutarate aldolase